MCRSSLLSCHTMIEFRIRFRIPIECKHYTYIIMLLAYKTGGTLRDTHNFI